MPELNVSIKHFYCYVRKEYLYDLQSHHGKTMACIVFGVTSKPGKALGFNLILENGAQFIHLPVSALCHKRNAKEQPLRSLQLWDNFGAMITVTVFDYLRGLYCDAFLPGEDKKIKPFPGEYMMTFDWYDNGFSDEPSQHKTAHLIKLSNGNFCLQPNNRTRWYDTSFVTPYDTDKRPDFKVNTHSYSAEFQRQKAVKDEFMY